MKRNLITLVVAITCSLGAWATDVVTVRHLAYSAKQPVVMDSVGGTQQRFRQQDHMDSYVPFAKLQQAAIQQLADIQMEKGTVNFLSFRVQADKMAQAGVKLNGARKNRVFVDGRESSHGRLSLMPGQHEVVVKFIPDTTCVSLTLACDSLNPVRVPDLNGKRLFTLADNMEVTYYTRASISPSGRFLLYSTSRFDAMGKSQGEMFMKDLTTGNVTPMGRNVWWMPHSDYYYYAVTDGDNTRMMNVDPTTGRRWVVAENLPRGNYSFSPNEKFIVIQTSDNGPQKEKEVYEIIHPDDRQPGWRNRQQINILDLETGCYQPLTFGHKGCHVNDISADGEYMIFSTSSDSLTSWPTVYHNYYRLNLKTMEKELLVENDGFLADVMFAGSNDRLILRGAAECLNRIGCTLPDNLVANQYDYQLYRMDLPSKQITPLTRDFNPSVQDGMVYNERDGYLYFSGENKDSVCLYRMDPVKGKIQRLEQPVECVARWTVSSQSNVLAFHGTSSLTPDRLYTLNTKNLKLTLQDDANAERMADIQLGEVKTLKFTCKRGYEVTGFYYLPPFFDPDKKYPVITYYYGGCSPTSHRFGNSTHYPAHVWNSLGYIVLLVNPSGASGFSQEWGARHVNTMGEGVAEDIIEMVQYLCSQVPQADEKHIGCLGASYGGFMTQCLQTKTDLFACAISHAGISSHTSYWGEGYWGYTYSQVSAAKSFPWSRKDLFVERSPLYNADKIHTPLLFTHGTVDTNVPIGESIQMYTALKVLGRPTAFVAVEGQDHHIMDYSKRIKWMNTMMAWFQKYLKEDSTWWDAIYTPKTL